MRVARRWRNARSCVTKTTAPAYSTRNVFEPRDRVDVEMVGRLVEQQHVGLGDERPRQQHAAPPAARQRVDDRVGRQIEARQHQLDALLDAPAVALFELVLQPAELLETALPCSLRRARRVTWW